MGGEGSNNPMNDGDYYSRLPSFVKVFRLEQHTKELVCYTLFHCTHEPMYAIFVNILLQSIYL